MYFCCVGAGLCAGGVAEAGVRHGHPHHGLTRILKKGRRTGPLKFQGMIGDKVTEVSVCL